MRAAIPHPRPPALRVIALACLAALTSACGGDPDIRRGDDALGLGRYSEAIGAYEAARKRLPSQSTPVERLASAHRSLAMSLMEQGKCDEARPHFSLAESLTRPVLVDYQQLYECDVARSVPKEAQVDDLKRLVALGDKRATVLRRLMTLELDLGREEEAVSRLEALEKRSSLTLDERRRLAEVLLRLNRRDQAWSHLKATVAAEPHDPINRLKLAELAEERGERSFAREIYEKLTTEFPQNPLTWLRLAEFCQREGDAEGARSAQARADALRTSKVPPPQEMRPLRKSRR